MKLRLGENTDFRAHRRFLNIRPGRRCPRRSRDSVTRKVVKLRHWEDGFDRNWVLHVSDQLFIRYDFFTTCCLDVKPVSDFYEQLQSDECFSMQFAY